MHSFLDPVTPVLEKILSLIGKNKYLSLSYTVDRVGFYRNTVTKYFGRTIFFEEITVNLPPTIHGARHAIKVGNTTVGSFGGSTSQDVATTVSQAELLERFSSWTPLDELKAASFERDKIRHLGANLKFTKSILGFRVKRFGMNQLYWGLASGKEFHQVTTNGVAGHFSYSEALLHGWLELIERDSLFVYWLNTISPKRIDLDDAAKYSEELSSLVKQFDTTKYDYIALDITTDVGIPTCLFVIKDKEDSKMTISTSAGFDGGRVLVSAIKECAVTAHNVFSQEPYTLPSPYIPFHEAKIDIVTRCRLYLTKEGVAQASFLWARKDTVSFTDFQTNHGTIPELSSVKARISYLKLLFKEKYSVNKKYDVFAYTFTNKLIKKFGFHVVRVISEALYPVYLNESFGDINHPRLKEFVINKGLEKVAKMNTFPHPFP